MKNNYLLLAVCLISMACTKEPEFKNVAHETVDLSRTYRNPQVPKELKAKLLEGAVFAAKGKEEKKDDHGSEKKEEHKEESKHENKEDHGADSHEKTEAMSEIGSDGYAKMRAKVYLVEITPGVLGGKNYAFDFASGGGDLDLAQYVSDQKKGSFIFSIVPDEKEEGELSIYHYSNSKRRRIGSDLVGNGCDVYSNITKIYEKEIKKNGLTVSTADRRHVSALSGMYLIRVKSETRLSLFYLDVFDSKSKQLLCR